MAQMISKIGQNIQTLLLPASITAAYDKGQMDYHAPATLAAICHVLYLYEHVMVFHHPSIQLGP